LTPTRQPMPGRYDIYPHARVDFIPPPPPPVSNCTERTSIAMLHLIAMIDIEGLRSLFSFSLIGRVQIGARALLVIDMVWLYHSPFPVERRGGILLVQMISTSLRGAKRKES
jgi:hypothetical protein